MYLRDILITGHPRSGTGYCSELLKINGLDVGHEVVGEHGISSWMFTVDCDKVPYTFDNITPNECEFKHIIQVVRNPVKCISSVYYTEQDSEDWRSNFLVLTGNRMERTVQSVIGWNILHREKADLVFPLEQPEKLLQYLVDNNLLDNYETLETKSNQRQHDNLTLSDIRDRINPQLYSKLLNFIEWYESL